MAIRYEDTVPIPNGQPPVVEIFSHSILNNAWLFCPQEEHSGEEHKPINWNIVTGGHADNLVNRMMDMAMERRDQNIPCIFGLHVAQNSISSGMDLKRFHRLILRTNYFLQVKLQGFHSYFWVSI